MGESMKTENDMTLKILYLSDGFMVYFTFALPKKISSA